MDEHKLYRNTDNKMIAGVCSGIGDYLSVDATLIRLAWVVLSLVFGCGILAYIVAALIIPKKPQY